MNSLQKSMKKKSTVNKAGNYTKPTMRKRLFNRIKAGGKGGNPGQWSARKAQMLASAYKKAGGGYRQWQLLSKNSQVQINWSTKLDYFIEKTTGEINIMVAKVETIRKKIKQGKKLGFSERARAVNKGLLPSKAKKKKNVKKQNYTLLRC